MSNEKDKKNEVMDYGKFFEGKRKEKVFEKKKKFSFSNLKNSWLELDKKTKVELVVLLIIISAIIGLLAFYFSQKAKISESSLYPYSREAYPQSR